MASDKPRFKKPALPGPSADATATPLITIDSFMDSTGRIFSEPITIRKIRDFDVFGFAGDIYVYSGFGVTLTFDEAMARIHALNDVRTFVRTGPFNFQTGAGSGDLSPTGFAICINNACYGEIGVDFLKGTYRRTAILRILIGDLKERRDILRAILKPFVDWLWSTWTFLLRLEAHVPEGCRGIFEASGLTLLCKKEKAIWDKNKGAMPVFIYEKFHQFPPIMAYLTSAYSNMERYYPPPDPAEVARQREAEARRPPDPDGTHIIHLSNVAVRAFQQRDDTDIVKHFGEPDFGANTMYNEFPRNFTLQMAKDWIDEANNRDNWPYTGVFDETNKVPTGQRIPAKYAICIQPPGKRWWEVRGQISLEFLSGLQGRTAQLGYYILKSEWRQTDIMKHLMCMFVYWVWKRFDRLARLEAPMYRVVPKAIEVLEHCGFYHFLSRRDAVWNNGYLYTMRVYEMVRSNQDHEVEKPRFNYLPNEYSWGNPQYD